LSLFSKWYYNMIVKSGNKIKIFYLTKLF
jgi:hypothetical protein